MRSTILALIATVLLKTGGAQDLELHHTSQPDTIAKLSTVVLSRKDIETRKTADTALTGLICSLLKSNPAGNLLQLPEAMAQFVSTDGRLQLINWTFPLGNNTWAYRAVIKTFSKAGSQTFVLRDQSAEAGSLKAIHQGSSWFGAIYYQLVEKKVGNETFYFLLGWNKTDPAYQSKLIECFAVNQTTGIPQIGKRIFPGNVPRYVLNYSSSASLSMKSSIQTRKARRGLFRRIKTIREEMIVFNRLNPKDIRFKQNPSFLYPSADVFDALVWEHNRWNLIRDIDARNEAREADNASPPTQMDLKPTFQNHP